MKSNNRSLVVSKVNTNNMNDDSYAQGNSVNRSNENANTSPPPLSKDG